MDNTIKDCLIKRSRYFNAKNEYVKQAFAFGRKYVKHLLKYEFEDKVYDIKEYPYKWRDCLILRERFIEAKIEYLKCVKIFGEEYKSYMKDLLLP